MIKTKHFILCKLGLFLFCLVNLLLCWKSLTNKWLTQAGNVLVIIPLLNCVLYGQLTVNVCVVQVWRGSREEQAPDHPRPARVSTGTEEEL